MGCVTLARSYTYGCVTLARGHLSSWIIMDVMDNSRSWIILDPS